MRTSVSHFAAYLGGPVSKSAQTLSVLTSSVCGFLYCFKQIVGWCLDLGIITSRLSPLHFSLIMPLSDAVVSEQLTALFENHK